MLYQIQQIIDYIIGSFLHTWPYLLVTVPIAVAVKLSGMSKYIKRAFTGRPIAAIFLATIVGAFSPLCSCSVIPVIAALLIGGVPLAPVMSFWIASPSMDPEIFFLTVSSLGWELAIWRMAATLVLSLGSGLVTHFLVQRGLLGEDILRTNRSPKVTTFRGMASQAWVNFTNRARTAFPPKEAGHLAISGGTLVLTQAQAVAIEEESACGCSAAQEVEVVEEESDCGCSGAQEAGDIYQDEGNQATEEATSMLSWKVLAEETWNATVMVVKFMLLAWFIGALIRLYVPETWITNILGEGNSWAIITAALLGIPAYTSNLAAMPLVGGLLAQGMHPGAALAFLIAGPTTTLPAMSAVWGIVNRKVFALYIAISMVGAVLLGYAYFLFG